MIEETRIRSLNEREPRRGGYVLYWMQQSQRASWNPALEVAIAEANERRLPVVTGFGLMDGYPEANLRHYAFMLQGLKETEASLKGRGIPMVVRQGAPDAVALELAKDAALVVCDRGYLRHQKAWRACVAKKARCPVLEVEGDVVVPVEVASDKGESAARTIRPKLHKVWDDYLRPIDEQKVEARARQAPVKGDIDLSDVDRALRRLDIDRGVKPVKRFTGGTSEARRRLDEFIGSRLQGYADNRSEPAAYQCSMLSPYLHFGQISPVEIACAVRQAKRGSGDDRAAYVEELVVRRELAMNHVNFADDYDDYRTLPGWAQRTLAEHRGDRRERHYSRRELETAETHDRYWNAAMREMVHTGYMHNYMRMYWAKKILEWSGTPEHAFRTTLALNNRYFLDGRDPNSFANVAWAFGLHDRPWTERPTFGKVRYMNAAGLERKFDMEAYVAAIDDLVAAEEH
jgi:deoxyribodipyrimidine photo-lyase